VKKSKIPWKKRGIGIFSLVTKQHLPYELYSSTDFDGFYPEHPEWYYNLYDYYPHRTRFYHLSLVFQKNGLDKQYFVYFGENKPYFRDLRALFWD